ncbi:c-type cytochrome [Kangiella koreensis]|uniref:Cytochrome c class I n=1 Tax=Kangiella koreensis (strain DSM 16069 / JCM 12317 / KCTC 12182 / SW-125) TaxID=523791 RepID=C7R6R3_KANKD|nr:cytochrome c class I [Kangiella koreensis]ACV25579.1 cytochrome c class I [Kangiella koreensis DSM 16069]
MKIILLLTLFSVLTGCTLSANQTVEESKQKQNQEVVAENSVSKELITQGAKYFRFRCGGCHEMSTEKGSSFGPHLEGIIGRKVGAVEGYDYSNALKEADFVWTEEVMANWLAKPESLLPGMCMTFKGVPDEDVRRAMIAFMKEPGL